MNGERFGRRDGHGWKAGHDWETEKSEMKKTTDKDPVAKALQGAEVLQGVEAVLKHAYLG